MAASVERVIEAVVAAEVLPRFTRLRAEDIVEKSSPTDVVTVADRAAEAALTEALTAVVAGSVVVGEEAVAEDPGVLRHLTGEAPVWIIDPIDGTHNFITDNARFTTLVALAHRGELIASWTYAPLLNLMATARRGAGAYVNGERLRVRPASGLRHLDVHVPHYRWWSAEHRQGFNRLSATEVSLAFFDTSGLEYVELAAGRRDAMVITWDYPWDHAAGLLLHAEAGGVALDRTGAPFRLAGGTALPVVIAADVETVMAVQQAYGGPDVAFSRRGR